jgi:8-oxo-dGTP pyrophosphatase MutT (NUDIX family)
MGAAARPDAPAGAERWACLRLARLARIERVPLRIGGEVLGAVARADLGALRALHAALQPGLGAEAALQVGEHGVDLHGPPAACTALLEPLNRALHDHGLVRGWRDETYAVVNRHGEAPRALIERAAARFWGTLTFGAHANGYVADANGRPTHLWIARRSFSKPTDPGLLDNLVGGGVPHGQTPFEALVREGWEEAGLEPALMRAATPQAVLSIERDIPEGWQREHLYVHDLALPPTRQPRNQDGEVAELHCLSLQQALAEAAAGTMTVDAALATLDFGLRHAALPPAEREALALAFNALKLD